MKIEKKIVLITGTSNGLGRAAAEKLARNGYTVYASMRNAATKNAAARQEIMALSGQENIDIKVVDLDVTDVDSIEQAVKTIIEQEGRLDVVVNNAGIGTYGAIEAYSVEEIQAEFDVNIFGALRVNKVALPYMRRQKDGLLVYVSSGLGRVVFPTMAVYCAAKFASEAFSEIYRYELAEFDIDSVIVEPGVFPTNFNSVAKIVNDKETNGHYGAIGQMAMQLPNQFGEGFKDEEHSVDIFASAVLKLIDTEKGKRPLRTPVGLESESVKPLNELSAKIQGGVLEAFGVSELAKLSS